MYQYYYHVLRFITITEQSWIISDVLVGNHSFVFLRAMLDHHVLTKKHMTPDAIARYDSCILRIGWGWQWSVTKTGCSVVSSKYLRLQYVPIPKVTRVSENPHGDVSTFDTIRTKTFQFFTSCRMFSEQKAPAGRSTTTQRVCEIENPSIHKEPMLTIADLSSIVDIRSICKEV